MATNLEAVKKRLISRDDVIVVFAASVFVVHIWSIYTLLKEIPAWILRLSYWELVGVISYTLLFALVESMIVLAFLIILAVLLPARIFRDRFISISTIFVFLAALWIIPVRLYENTIRSWGMIGVLGVLFLAMISFVIAYLVVLKSQKVEQSINAIVQRVTLLAYIYVFVDIVAMIVVISRNI
jgi:hypothetical protein